MKKSKLYAVVTLILLCASTLFLQSCSDEKYTVWTDYCTYSEFQTSWQTTLDDGYYKRVEISQDLWDANKKILTGTGHQKWDETTIKKWFIAHGFGEVEATKESSWLVVVEHGMIVTREGNMVYLILK